MTAELSVISSDMSDNRIIDNLSPLVLYVSLCFRCDIWVKVPPVFMDVSTVLMPCSIDLTCCVLPCKGRKLKPVQPEELWAEHWWLLQVISGKSHAAKPSPQNHWWAKAAWSDSSCSDFIIFMTELTVLSVSSKTFSSCVHLLQLSSFLPQLSSFELWVSWRRFACFTATTTSSDRESSCMSFTTTCISAPTYAGLKLPRSKINPKIYK